MLVLDLTTFKKMIVGAQVLTPNFYVLTLHARIWSLATCVDILNPCVDTFNSRIQFLTYVLMCQHFLLMCRHLQFTNLILVFIFNKLAVTSTLLEIFKQRLLSWKLDFWSYNLGSKISSFGLVNTDIISSEVHLSTKFLKTQLDRASLFLS